MSDRTYAGRDGWIITVHSSEPNPDRYHDDRINIEGKAGPGMGRDALNAQYRGVSADEHYGDSEGGRNCQPCGIYMSDGSINPNVAFGGG